MYKDAMEGGISMGSKVVHIFKALGCEHRIEILKALSKERLCLCELAKKFSIDMSTLSRHVNELVRLGLLHEEKEGTKKFFTIAEPRILKVIEIVEEIGGERDGSKLVSNHRL